MPEKCLVFNCTTPVTARGLCDAHYRRLIRRGTLETVRPDDWGKREAHPAYSTWKGLHRYHKPRTDSRWLDDFWVFAAEIPDKPEKARAQRYDETKDWSKDNFYWKTTKLNEVALAERAAYMREHHRRNREADPDYGRHHDLKKNYGVSLDWYKAQLEKQNGVCMICEQPETASIKGKTLRLAVDHCHDSQEVRGLLCAHCNKGIGSLKHDKRLLQKAIEYLEKPPLEKF